MNKLFELPYKYLDENCKKLGVSPTTAKESISLIEKTFTKNWFQNKDSYYQKRNVPMFYKNPLYLNSKNALENNLMEIITLAKYLSVFKKDSNIEKVVNNLKSDEILEYDSSVHQLAMAFRFSISKGKQTKLEPKTVKNIADISTCIYGKKYFIETAILGKSYVENSLNKSLYMILETLKPNKNYPGIRFILKIDFKDYCYEANLPNIFSEINNDLKLILTRIYKGLLKTKVSSISKFYTITFEPFSKDEPNMPFIYDGSNVINFTDIWDFGFGIKMMKLKNGIQKPEIYRDIKEDGSKELAKILIRYPTMDDKKIFNRLEKKVLDEFGQLKSFGEGKIVIIEVDDWFFRKQKETEHLMMDLLKKYKDLSAIILTKGHANLRHVPEHYSFTHYSNPENIFKLNSRFFKLFERK